MGDGDHILLEAVKIHAFKSRPPAVQPRFSYGFRLHGEHSPVGLPSGSVLRIGGVVTHQAWYEGEVLRVVNHVQMLRTGLFAVCAEEMPQCVRGLTAGVGEALNLRSQRPTKDVVCYGASGGTGDKERPLERDLRDFIDRDFQEFTREVFPRRCLVIDACEVNAAAVREHEARCGLTVGEIPAQLRGKLEKLRDDGAA